MRTASEEKRPPKKLERTVPILSDAERSKRQGTNARDMDREFQRPAARVQDGDRTTSKKKEFPGICFGARAQADRRALARGRRSST